MQRANVVIGRKVLVFVVVILDAEHDGAIPPGGGVQIAEHVIPRPDVGAGHTGVAEDISGLGGEFVGEARRIRKARIAQSRHQVVAVLGLRPLFVPQNQLKASRGRVHLQNRGIKWRAEDQAIEGEEAQEGKRQRQDKAAACLWRCAWRCWTWRCH